MIFKANQLLRMDDALAMEVDDGEDTNVFTGIGTGPSHEPSSGEEGFHGIGIGTLLFLALMLLVS